MVLASSRRSEMMLNVDFRDIWANEALPKFRFQNTFVTSKKKVLVFFFVFWLSLRTANL